MNLAERVVGPRRNAVQVNMVARHTWGPQPRRVVRFVIEQTTEGLEASVWVASGNRVVLEERFPIASFTRTAPRGVPVVAMVLPDGTERVAPHGGCGCGSPLKHWRPPGPTVAGA